MITFTVTAGGTPSISGVGIKDVTPASSENQEVNTGTILNTLTVANTGDLLSGNITITEGADINETATPLALGGQTIAQIEADFDTTTGTHNWSTYGITASISGDSLTFSQTLGDPGTANVTKNGLLTDQIQASTATQSLTGPTMLNTLTAGGAADPLSGILTIQEGADAKATTSTYNLAGQTIDEIVAAFTTGAEANLGITATENVAKTQVTFSQTPGDLGTAKVTTPGTILDGTALNATPIAVATGTMLDTLSVNNSTDRLGGTLNLTSGFGGTVALPLGTTGTTDTLADLAADFTTSADKNLGIAANLNPTGTQITFTQSGGGFPAAVGSTSITDSEGNKNCPQHKSRQSDSLDRQRYSERSSHRRGRQRYNSIHNQPGYWRRYRHSPEPVTYHQRYRCLLRDHSDAQPGRHPTDVLSNQWRQRHADPWKPGKHHGHHAGSSNSD